MIHAAATLLHTHIACNTSEERNVISRKIHFGEEFIFAAKYLSFLSVSGFGWSRSPGLKPLGFMFLGIWAFFAPKYWHCCQKCPSLGFFFFFFTYFFLLPVSPILFSSFSGTSVSPNMDVFLENFQTALAPPPPPPSLFGNYIAFFVENYA